jgi:putative restriction endonuclease
LETEASVSGAYPGNVAIDREWRVRLAAFQWLAELGAPQGELTRRTLTRGFDLDGVRVPLVGPQGIWSPAGFRVPLSIATIPSGPYSDSVDSESNRLRYSYRLPDPEHRDNAGLRRAIVERTPLVYFYRTDPGHYLATFPVYVVGDDRQSSMFSVKVDEAWVLQGPSPAIDLPDTPLRREYATRNVRQRLFQAEFRRRVVDAYRERCALCRLRHRELLDAAHITADSDAGDPIVSNGMALCKLHHAAFDGFFFTVTPDYRVVVKPSILEESDGPMLIVGLQQIHGAMIQLPSKEEHRPDRDRLAVRYEAFVRAS